MADTSQRWGWGWGGLHVWASKRPPLLSLHELAPLPLAESSPSQGRSLWCLCHFLSAPLSFSNLIILLWTLSCRGLSRQARRNGGQGDKHVFRFIGCKKTQIPSAARVKHKEVVSHRSPMSSLKNIYWGWSSADELKLWVYYCYDFNSYW